MMKAGYDFLGNIAILKFKNEKEKEKKEFAKKLMKERKQVSTVLEKVERVKGKLRTIKTKHVLGKKTKEALYRESDCVFKLNIDSCYFSPRLSNERLEIAARVKQNDRVLVLFAGVAPFPIIIARHSKARRIVAVELGKECCRYARENVRLNKVLDRIEIIQGDVKKLDKLLGKDIRFDRIVMPRPQLKETFLRYIWKFCKKNTEIYYYDFGKDAEEIIERILKEARKARKKIRITGFKKAGEIAPYKYRWRADFRMV